MIINIGKLLVILCHGSESARVVWLFKAARPKINLQVLLPFKY